MQQMYEASFGTTSRTSTTGPASLRWPTKDEYDLAILQWQQALLDPDLRIGQLARDNFGITRFGGANLYVSVYKIGNWMVRCFCSNPPNPTPYDIRERYMALDQFCRVNHGRVSALVPVFYIERGINMGGYILPVVKMPFLNGLLPLGEFIAARYTERATMWRLSEAWLHMIRELEVVPMAHGDLDLTNVLVEDRGSDFILKLIDYDNAWIPALAGRTQTEYGHAAFQHPDFLPPRPRPYTAEMDRFSALVLYISLKLISDHPELYQQWGADESDRLLLSEADYKNAGLADSRIAQMRDAADKDLRPYVFELYESLREHRMPRSLGDLAHTGQFNTSFATPYISQPQFAPAPQASPMRAPAVMMWQNAVYNAGTPWMATQQGQQPTQLFAPPNQQLTPPLGQSYLIPMPPTSGTPPVTGSSAWKDDLGRFSPSSWLSHGQTAPNSWGATPNATPIHTNLFQYMSPPAATYATSPAATKGTSKGGRASLIIALILVILLILFIILFANGAFSHLSGQSGPPSSALVALSGKHLYRRKVCSDE